MLRDEQNRILYLSPTVAGSIHDKALADEMELAFLPEQSLLLDLGYLGYQPEDAKTILLFQKPCSGEWLEYDKRYNRWLARTFRGRREKNQDRQRENPLTGRTAPRLGDAHCR